MAHLLRAFGDKDRVWRRSNDEHEWSRTEMAEMAEMAKHSMST